MLNWKISSLDMNLKRFGMIKLKNITSINRDIDLGFGGYVYAEPGMYGNVVLLDVKSMNSHSAIAMNLFGKYSERFANLVETRVDIKEKNFDKAKARWNGKIDKYLNDINNAKKLSTALKTAYKFCILFNFC